MENQFFEKDNFGDRLKCIRVEKGLTKIELANLSGISNVQINRYEKNTAKPSDLIIKKLSKALKMSFEDLAGIALKAKFDFEDLESSLERLKTLPEYDLIIIKEVIDRFTGNKEVKSVNFK